LSPIRPNTSPASSAISTSFSAWIAPKCFDTAFNSRIGKPTFLRALRLFFVAHATLVGWALDGFGIYVEYDAKGRLLSNSSLDVCHGRTSSVLWHGKTTRIYHYDMTFEFPYTVGCFRGNASSFIGMTISGAPFNR